MVKVIITAENPRSSDNTFRAATRGHESVGSTPGAALHALAEQLDEKEINTLIVLQNLRPDEFFTAAQQERLAALLAERRIALDSGLQMDADAKAELETLIDAELDGAAQRAATMIRELRP